MSDATMKAAQVLEANKGYHISDVPKPSPGPNDIIIKMGAAGFCHTDLTVIKGLKHVMEMKFPVIGSHEPAGTIVEVGKDVKGFKVGDRVGALAFRGVCHDCSDCNLSVPQYCENLQGYFGFTVDGAFAEYAKLDADFTVPIPDAISFIQAAPLFCAGPTVYEAIRRCELEKGKRIAIIGLGALGHLGIQFAKALGYEVVGCDARNEPLEIVSSPDFPLPADMVLNSRTTTAPDAITQITNKLGKTKNGYEGVDAVVVCADAKGAFTFGIDILAKHGVMVCVSLPEGMWELSPKKLVFQDLTIKGSLLITTGVAKEMMEVAEKHGVKTHITKVWKLEEVNEMVKEFQKPDMKGKFVVSFEEC